MKIAQCGNCGKVKSIHEFLFLGGYWCDEDCRIRYIQRTVFVPKIKQGPFVPFDYERERKQYDE